MKASPTIWIVLFLLVLAGVIVSVGLQGIDVQLETNRVPQTTPTWAPPVLSNPAPSITATPGWWDALPTPIQSTKPAETPATQGE